MLIVNALFLAFYLLASVLPQVYLGYIIKDYRDSLPYVVLRPFSFDYKKLLDFFSSDEKSLLTTNQDKERIRRLIISVNDFKEGINKSYVPVSVIVIILNLF